MANYKDDWDKHWNSLEKKRPIFNFIVQVYRNLIISNAVNHYFEKYFSSKGIFIEAGCGTAQSSAKVNKKNRFLVGLDISLPALKEARLNKKMDCFVQADIFRLPFKDNSLNGIWNLGVMEHFQKQEITRILNQFYKVVKKNSNVILLWPPNYGASEIVLGLIEKTHNLFSKKKIVFFPDEVSRLEGKKHAKSLIETTDFRLHNYHFSWRDMFTHGIVVLKKL